MSSGIWLFNRNSKPKQSYIKHPVAKPLSLLIDTKTKHTQLLLTPHKFMFQVFFFFFSLKIKNKFRFHSPKRLTQTQSESFQNNSLHTKGSFSAMHNFLPRPFWALLVAWRTPGIKWNKSLPLGFWFFFASSMNYNSLV